MYTFSLTKNYNNLLTIILLTLFKQPITNIYIYIYIQHSSAIHETYINYNESPYSTLLSYVHTRTIPLNRGEVAKINRSNGNPILKLMDLCQLYILPLDIPWTKLFSLRSSV